jgi:hypothetical protein
LDSFLPIFGKQPKLPPSANRLLAFSSHPITAPAQHSLLPDLGCRQRSYSRVLTKDAMASGFPSRSCTAQAHTESTDASPCLRVDGSAGRKLRRTKETRQRDLEFGNPWGRPASDVTSRRTNFSASSAGLDRVRSAPGLIGSCRVHGARPGVGRSVQRYGRGEVAYVRRRV